MAGQLTDNLTLNTLDYTVTYISVVLGLCVWVSFFLFLLILLIRQILPGRAVFLKGMLWGILLIAPFMGKLRFFHKKNFFCCWTYWWIGFCNERWWVRYGYLLGMILCAGVLFSGRRRLGRLVNGMEMDRVCGQKVRIHDRLLTPFSTGLFRPSIVLPQILQKELETEEQELVLLHERTHIRLGHLWFCLLWDILQILLWPDFFFAVCRRYFHEDLEQICDRVTIRKSGQDAYAYGLLLLKNMQLLNPEAPGLKRRNVTIAFAAPGGYRDMRKRFSRIASFTPYRRSAAGALCLGSAVLIVGILLLILYSSYPRYTEVREIVLYQGPEEAQMIILEPGSFEQAVSWDEEYIYIRRTPMDKLLEELGAGGEHFWISFGGYMKLPSMGGSCSCVDVDYRGQEEELRIPYWNGESNFCSVLLKQIP